MKKREKRRVTELKKIRAKFAVQNIAAQIIRLNSIFNFIGAKLTKFIIIL